MSLSVQAIADFKEAYFLDFEVVISDEQAREKAEQLINLMRVITRTVPTREDMLK